MSSTFKGRETDLKPAPPLSGCGTLAESHHLSDPQFLLDSFNWTVLSSDDPLHASPQYWADTTAVGIIAITEGMMDLQQCLGEALPTARAPRATVSINWDDV